MEHKPQVEVDLELLSLVRMQITASENRLREYVGYARASGASWQQVGRALGVSKQAAWHAFARLEDRPLSDPAFDALFNLPRE